MGASQSAEDRVPLLSEQPAPEATGPDNQRWLVLGFSGAGKSALINLLLHNRMLNRGGGIPDDQLRVSSKELAHPAEVADGRGTNGCTRQMTPYVTHNHVLLDTIGVTDPRFTKDEVLVALCHLLHYFRIGLTGIVLVVTHQVFTAADEVYLAFLTALLGDALFQHAVLVITHYDLEDNTRVDVGEYRGRNHSPMFKRLLDRFQLDRIVVGSLKAGDTPLDIGARRAMVRNVQAALRGYVDAQPQRLYRGIRSLKAFGCYVASRFRLPSQERARLEKLCQEAKSGQGAYVHEKSDPCEHTQPGHPSECIDIPPPTLNPVYTEVGSFETIDLSSLASTPARSIQAFDDDANDE